MPRIRRSVTPPPLRLPPPDLTDPRNHDAYQKVVVGPGALRGNALNPRRCGEAARTRLMEAGFRWWPKGRYWWRPVP